MSGRRAPESESSTRTSASTAGQCTSRAMDPSSSITRSSLRGRWEKQWGHVALVPDQLVRDMLIVDYMVQQKNMEFTSACDIWNKWEGYEFALLEDRGDDYYNNCMN